MRSRRFFFVWTTVAVVSTVTASCSNAPSSAPAAIHEPHASNVSEVVVFPTETRGVVRGFVRDVETKKPILYANVMIIGTTLGAMSVRNGEFAISGVAPGIYTVRAMMMGYKAAQMDSVVVSAAKETHVSFAMTRSADRLRP